MTGVITFNGENRFLEQALKDGINLLVEAKNYMSYQEKREREGAGLSLGLRIGYQQTRITARLMHALAWLMSQKAVAEGELTAEQLHDADWQLGGGAECTAVVGHEDERLPKGLRNLLERSHGFYLRVARLQEMLAAQELPATHRAAPAFMGLHIIHSDAGQVAARA